MLAQHVLFPGTPKDLAYLSSLYDPYHVYWKEDHKEATKTRRRRATTFCGLTTQKTARRLMPWLLVSLAWRRNSGLRISTSFLHAVHWLCLRMSYRGIAVDKKFKLHAQEALGAAILEREAWLAEISVIL